MARSFYASLQGKSVAITNVTGAFRSCHSCGGEDASVDLTPTGTHIARLICNGCGTQTAYLGREHLAAMLAAEQQGVA